VCCGASYLICSACLDKLRKRKKCHYCSRYGDYNRSYATEKILESMKVPCPNTEYGCDMKTSYHEKEEHVATCSHAPCFCPEPGCRFAGSAGMLVAHFTTEHRWPVTKFRYGYFLWPDVREGVHVLSGEDGHLFLLNMAPGPLGCVVVTVFCVRRPRDTEPIFRCAVYLNYWENNSSHAQSSEFQVPITTLAVADGIPRDCSVFVLVPRFYLDKESKIRVTIY